MIRYSFIVTVAHPITLSKRNKKSWALRGKHPDVSGLINSVSKRKVALLIRSFFYFVNPFFVCVLNECVNRTINAVQKMEDSFKSQNDKSEV